MTFPNGYHGVKKVFTAEILSLISAVLFLVFGIAMAIAIGAALGGALTDNADAAGAALVTMGGASIFMIIGFILLIIAYIMQIVGLHQAGKEDDSFRTAFLVTIFALIMTVVAAILTVIFGTNSIVDDLAQLIQRIAQIVVIFMVINGVQTFAAKLNNEKLLNKGNKIAWVIVIPYFLAAIAGLIYGIFGINDTTASISGIMAIISAILNIVGTILYLVYLGQAKKMLKNN